MTKKKKNLVSLLWNKKLTIDNKGITLIEMVVSMAVGVIVLAAIIQMVLYGMRVYTYQVFENEQYNLFDHIEVIMSEELRYAESIYIDNSSLSAYNEEYKQLKCGESGITIEYHNDQNILLDSSIYNRHKIELEFKAVGNENLQVTVRLDTNSEMEFSETFTVKILNLNTLGIIEVSGNNKLIYN